MGETKNKGEFCVLFLLKYDELLHLLGALQIRTSE